MCSSVVVVLQAPCALHTRVLIEWLRGFPPFSRFQFQAEAWNPWRLQDSSQLQWPLSMRMRLTRLHRLLLLLLLLLVDVRVFEHGSRNLRTARRARQEQGSLLLLQLLHLQRMRQLARRLGIRILFLLSRHFRDLRERLLVPLLQFQLMSKGMLHILVSLFEGISHILLSVDSRQKTQGLPMQRLSETFFEHTSEILRTFDSISCPLHVPQSGGHICRCVLSVSLCHSCHVHCHIAPR